MLIRRALAFARPRRFRSAARPFPARRFLSAAPNPPRLRVSTVFAALVCLGVGTTAYGVYDFYTSMTLWPLEVRSDLRAGVKAKHQGDLALSARFLRRAWETAQSLPQETFAPDPLLKLSGIGIALAGVLEAHDMPRAAYQVYADVWQRLQQQQQRGGAQERIRAVAVACKLGEMANEYQLPPDEEERWLSWAVTELLKIAQDARSTTATATTAQSSSQSQSSSSHADSDSSRVVLSDLDLPPWVSRQDIGAPLEALGAFYARTGNIEYALPLYLQAISILVPPPGNHNNNQKPSSPEDRCRGAQLMNNLAELLIRHSPTPETLHQSEEWAKQALALIDKTRQSSSSLPPTCEQALAAVLFNLGSLREMADDRSAARDMFTAGLNHSKAIGMKQGIVEARAALRRLDRIQSVVPDKDVEPENRTRV